MEHPENLLFSDHEGALAISRVSMTEKQAVLTMKEAQAAGLTRYFTGKPCKNGHVAERTVSGRCCVVCRDTRVRDWNSKNVERRRRIRDNWRSENSAQEKASKRAWYERNKDTHLARSRANYQANPERHRKWTKAWKDAHPIECALHGINTRARRAGWRGAPLTLNEYVAMVDQQGGVCAYCFAETKLTLDHVEPFVLGGQHVASNCVLCCVKCNTLKIGYPLDAFLDLLRRLRPNTEIASSDNVRTLIAERCG